MARLRVCEDVALVAGSSIVIAGQERIAVHRTEDGNIYATSDTCSHEQWSLGEDSDLEGNEIVCPLHIARFDVRTGKPLCLPAIEPLRTYGVVVDGGEIFVIEEDEAAS